MNDNEEWFEVARRNYVAALNASVTGTRLDDLEEEYEEAKRFRNTTHENHRHRGQQTKERSG